MKWRILSALVCGLALASPQGRAAEYPTRPIKLIVPYAAGGPTDVLGRMVADYLGRTETRPAGGDGEKPVLRAQILRDEAHGRAVAAMAGDHHKLPDTGARDALANRHPGRAARRFARQRQRAGIVDMFGRNSNRLNRQEGRGNVLSGSNSRARAR